MRLFASKDERRQIRACKRLKLAASREEIIQCCAELGDSDAVLRELATRPIADVMKYRRDVAILKEGTIFAGKGFFFWMINK